MILAPDVIIRARETQAELGMYLTPRSQSRNMFLPAPYRGLLGFPQLQPCQAELKEGLDLWSCSSCVLVGLAEEWLALHTGPVEKYGEIF